PSDDIRMAVRDIMLFPGIVAQIEQTQWPRGVASAQPRIITGLILFVGCQQRHAIRPAWIDPTFAAAAIAAILSRQNVQFPAGVAHGRQPDALVSKDHLMRSLGRSR